MKKIIYIIPILVITFTTEIRACKCAWENTVKEEINYSNSVIVGIILTKELVLLPDSSLIKIFEEDSLKHETYPYSQTVSKYSFEIQDIYKGKFQSKIVFIYSGRGHGDCGFNFDVGKKYIVYGLKETYFGQSNNEINYPEGDDILWTNICRRTKYFYQKEIDEIEKYIKKK